MLGGKSMKKEYDFAKGVKNPYIKRLKTQITINIDTDVVQYFKDLSLSLGMPYQSLINLYLKDCATNKKVLSISWK